MVGYGCVWQAPGMATHGLDHPSYGETFALPAGRRPLSDLATRATPIGPQSKKDAAEALAELGPTLEGLQERLFAQSTAGAQNRMLVILQGMDTSGKDGVVKHVLGLVDPGGVRLASFKAPTEEELAHDFLWRIEQQVPPAGVIGVFNRSHYEDVLIVRVRSLVPEPVWRARYAAINEFERRLTGEGVTVVKCFLHISADTQLERLRARLDDPTKYWKYNPADAAERALWPRYQEAYADALAECSTADAPWYVIPSDRKWYRNWAIAALLAEKLAELDPQYPPPDYDIATEKARLTDLADV